MTKVRTADAANATAVAVDSIAGDATKAVATSVVTEPPPTPPADQPTKLSDTDAATAPQRRDTPANRLKPAARRRPSR